LITQQSSKQSIGMETPLILSKWRRIKLLVIYRKNRVCCYSVIKKFYSIQLVIRYSLQSHLFVVEREKRKSCRRSASSPFFLRYRKCYTYNSYEMKSTIYSVIVYSLTCCIAHHFFRCNFFHMRDSEVATLIKIPINLTGD